MHCERCHRDLTVLLKASCLGLEDCGGSDLAPLGNSKDPSIPAKRYERYSQLIIDHRNKIRIERMSP